MFTCSVVLGLALTAAAERPAEEAKKVTDALAGYWDVTAVERDGVKSENSLRYKRMVFTGETLKVTCEERPGAKSSQARYDARYRLDPRSKGIEVTMQNGPDQEKTFYGV